MSTTYGVTSVVAGVVDGSSSLIQHMQELQENPGDQVAYAQVNADFQNTVAAMTALAPGLGASTAFVALSADFTLLIQKFRNGVAITKADIVPIAGNLITLTGQVIEAAGLAGTLATGGISLPVGLTVGELLDATGAAVSLAGLGLDIKDVRATLGQLADALANANSTATTDIPTVIITAARVTTTDTSLSSDGHTLIENLSDQSTRFTTVSPDGTSVTKVYKEADGTISSTQVQIYTDSSRSTLSSTVDSASDPATNQTTITTTNFNAGDGKSDGYSTEIIDNANSAVSGSASGYINQNGEISSADVSGSGISINANNANIFVNSGSLVSSAGLDNTIYAGSNDLLLISGDNTNTIIGGDNTSVVNFDASDITTAYGANDITYNSGSNDITSNYGMGDQTYDFGASEQNYNYGSDEYDYSGDASDTNYDANGSDTGGGYTFDPGYGGGGYGGGYYGYYGYYGVSTKTAPAAAAKGGNIGSIAQFDQAHGKPGAAAVAQKANAEIGDAIAHNAQVVLSGAKWDHNTISWSLGSGGQFSGNMSASEEQAVKQAFAEWGAATGLTFVEAAPKAAADITVGMGSFDTANTGVVGFTTFKAKDGRITPGAVVRVEDVSQDALVAGADGSSVYGRTDASFSQALLHEIGHALGFGDNASQSSVESYYLNADNRSLSSNDIAQAGALYSKNGGAVHGAHQMVQAMSTFAPAPVGHAEAANDSIVAERSPLFASRQAHVMR